MLHGALWAAIDIDNLEIEIVYKHIRWQAVDKSMPVLRVNGIAFQASGGVDNMAIVNGTPVSGGSLIEGTIVEEVQKDRVLFQRNGERFSILLGQSN